MSEALRILTVDDELSITQSMQFIFAAPRYQVTSAESGNDALAQVAMNSNRYDLIIADQKMPQGSGLDLVCELRKRGFRGKIMILSAHLSPDIRRAYEQMNVDLMLDKPFDVHELRQAVSRLAA